VVVVVVSNVAVTVVVDDVVMMVVVGDVEVIVLVIIVDEVVFVVTGSVFFVDSMAKLNIRKPVTATVVKAIKEMQMILN